MTDEADTVTDTPAADVPPVSIDGATALVTGSNRGLGRHLVRELLERGARRIYAASRRGDVDRTDRVIPVRLDITDDAQIAAAVEIAGDITILVNNAGISRGSNFVTSALSDLRAEMDTNYWGTLAMVRAFAPVLARNGGGAILNVLSAQSWFAYPDSNGYHASKAAEWALTNGIRLELAAQSTRVVALHAGAFDTEFSASYEGPKEDPADIARIALVGLADGSLEVLADEWSRMIKASLDDDPGRLYAAIGLSVH